MVFFGTGSFLNSADVSDTTTQALYGVFDDLVSPSGNSTPWVAESNLSAITINMPSTSSDIRTISTVTTPWYNISGKRGWVLQLTGTNVTPGERVIAPPVRYTVSGKVDAFLFTSIVPSSDDCLAGVDAWITGVDAMTGGYATVFDGLAANSVKVSGGSPRGVFVLQDGGDPTLYISQTVFNGVLPTTTYSTTTGGVQAVTINGTAGQTQVLGIKLTKQTATAARTRQAWRQLK
jgi:type IV pilus assembly protein PilY1